MHSSSRASCRWSRLSRGSPRRSSLPEVGPRLISPRAVRLICSTPPPCQAPASNFFQEANGGPGPPPHRRREKPNNRPPRASAAPYRAHAALPSTTRPMQKTHAAVASAGEPSGSCPQAVLPCRAMPRACKNAGCPMHPARNACNRATTGTMRMPAGVACPLRPRPAAPCAGGSASSASVPSATARRRAPSAGRRPARRDAPPT